MKTRLLHGIGEYDKLCELNIADYPKFKRLLKGGIHGNTLYITPIDKCQTLECVDFIIEHHQIFYSESDGKLYLVFRPLWNESGNLRFFYYDVDTYSDSANSQIVLWAYKHYSRSLGNYEVYFPVHKLSIPRIRAK